MTNTDTAGGMFDLDIVALDKANGRDWRGGILVIFSCTCQLDWYRTMASPKTCTAHRGLRSIPMPRHTAPQS